MKKTISIIGSGVIFIAILFFNVQIKNDTNNKNKNEDFTNLLSISTNQAQAQMEIDWDHLFWEEKKYECTIVEQEGTGILGWFGVTGITIFGNGWNESTVTKEYPGEYTACEDGPTWCSETDCERLGS